MLDTFTQKCTRDYTAAYTIEGICIIRKSRIDDIASVYDIKWKNKLALDMQLTTECNLRITTNARAFICNMVYVCI